jgi:protein involved in polysaccharide export with SLBB domain
MGRWLLRLTLFIASVAVAYAADPLGVQNALGFVPGSTSSSTNSSTAQAPAQIPPTSNAAPAQPAQPTLSALPAPGTPGAQPAATPPSATALTSPPASAVLQPPQAADYAANMSSNVFGAQLFTGAFAQQGPIQFNPDYIIAIGDRVDVKLWGGYNLDTELTVDPHGNVFMPYAGPIKLQGVHNKDLQSVIEHATSKVFRANVFVYASLAAAQPVRVFVSGYVNRPGLYGGTSMDSLLHYLDLAGGIDPARGSFLDVQVKRGTEVRQHINLYDFLLHGVIPLIQFADGDVIFVAPRLKTVTVSGLAENARQFEFSGDDFKLADLVKMAKPKPEVTNVRIVRNTGPITNVEYYPLEEAGKVRIENGDDVNFTADKKPGTITVRVEGEHLSPQEYVLPYGTRLGELLSKIKYSDRSDTHDIQLFRLSVQDRQKQLLQIALQSLASSVLTARSATSDEASLRKDEASLILQWVDRAKTVQPSGQVVIVPVDQHKDLLLENGDIINVPTKNNLVLISGEVLFANSIIYDHDYGLGDYVRKAGGYSQNADTSRVVVAHLDGTFSEAETGGGLFGSTPVKDIRPGDQILVLPKVDTKSLQITKDLTQILFQIAVSAKVVLGL